MGGGAGGEDAEKGVNVQLILVYGGNVIREDSIIVLECFQQSVKHCEIKALANRPFLA